MTSDNSNLSGGELAEASGAASPVLILGAGINGAALAREFVLGGVPVVVIDVGDLARGATAYSSRLIHGGLRYLEYGEFDLVRESLAERARLLKLAGQFVKPLRLFVPAPSRFGGLQASARRFLKLRPTGGAPAPRGLWLIRAGLKLYDWYARDPTLPKHQVIGRQDPDAPPVDRGRYPWLCAYYDAQIRFPERFVVALFDDARRAAAERGVSFQLLTYHRARLDGRTVSVFPEPGCEPPAPASRAFALAPFQPAAIVNATGAWVDHTLRELHVSSPPLMAGTKGSHFVTSHPALRQALAGGGIYTEAADGRPIFILPFGQAVLVGTTDLPFSGDPADAVATEDELQYLLSSVNRVLPTVGLTRDDVDLHYSGVRPLPHSGESTTAAITRRHWLQEHPEAAIPLFSVIGGKLTTCRSLAESSVAAIRTRIGLGPPAQTSRDRPLPRGAATDAEDLAGIDLPRDYVRRVIDHEWVRRLEDLVERRLMLLYDRRLSAATLRQLAALMVEAGALSEDQVEYEVRRTIDRLQVHFGKRLAP